jgi:putative tricarboxylic transport membrane protein
MGRLVAISGVLRAVAATAPKPRVAGGAIAGVFAGQWRLMKRYWKQFLRGSALGTLIGALPGAGADIAAWIAYAVSKRFSREPEKFGTGHVEGIIESGAANNGGVSGAWIPALVFGIPGDSITAIVIGVLYVKGMNPGPTIFINSPELIYAVFIVFFLANIAMLPLGWVAIKLAKQILRVPTNVLMPIILMFCIVGAFAINNSVFGVVIALALGVLGFLMEENGFPIAPAILGLVLGPMLEQNFITSMIKANGDLLGFFDRPLAAALGAVTIAVWLIPALMMLVRRSRTTVVAPIPGSDPSNDPGGQM